MAYDFSPEFNDYVRNVPVKPERGTVLGRALLEGKIIHIADVLAIGATIAGRGLELLVTDAFAAHVVAAFPLPSHLA